ncbi:hypothetical protein [Isoptericola sp. BMS4]|uniref:hypothetical protein n=1 Tax=Isoptericola sp. BMS4 TaxID=2527875 RepID=UPI00141E9B8F|nr:hypothetical protein [Isoptericola sp. BMS4]
MTLSTATADEAELPEDSEPEDVVAAATHWAFVYPNGWWPVPLDDAERIDERVRAVVVRRLGRRDDQARARREARDHLSRAAHGAAEEGAIGLTVFSMDVGDMAITGTMAVFPIEVGAGTETDELLARIIGSLSGADVDRRTLDDGWVLRGVRQSDIERTDADGDPVLPELRADYWMGRRGLKPVLHVSFATPFVPLRTAMLELFDAVVLSLHPVVRGTE